MTVLCSDGCNICFHYPACWHAFERLHKADHPEFSFKARTHYNAALYLRTAQHAALRSRHLQ